MIDQFFFNSVDRTILKLLNISLDEYSFFTGKIFHCASYPLPTFQKKFIFCEFFFLNSKLNFFLNFSIHFSMARSAELQLRSIAPHPIILFKSTSNYPSRHHFSTLIQQETQRNKSERYSEIPQKRFVYRKSTPIYLSHFQSFLMIFYVSDRKIWVFIDFSCLGFIFLMN